MSNKSILFLLSLLCFSALAFADSENIANIDGKSFAVVTSKTVTDNRVVSVDDMISRKRLVQERIDSLKIEKQEIIRVLKLAKTAGAVISDPEVV